MKKNFSLIAFICALLLSAASSASAQTLINELDINPPGTDNPCEYVEIRGTPGAALTNTYFVVFEGDALPSGTADFVVDLSTRTIGSNGLLVIVSPTACPGRTIPAGTTVVTDAQLDTGGGGIENGTNTYVLLTSTTPIVEGTDYDTDNNGTLEGLPAGVTILDAIGVTDYDFGDIVYFGQVVTATSTTIGAPQAITRFTTNNTAISSSAWYGGSLDTAAGNSSTVYSSTITTANFPTGGALTPGAVNVGTFIPKDVIVDFNGDGRSDYAVTGFFRGGSTGQEKIWYIQPNGAAASASYQVQWGIFTDRNVPEDFDGDGKDDIAVWRENVGGRGFFYILRSSNNTVQVEQFGAPGDDPTIVGDYDGDNKADVAVFRNPGLNSTPPCGSATVWYYRPSGTPGVDFRYICWGANGDRPAPGDYDADGKTDAAVFRSAQGIFFVNKSGGGTDAVYWGANGDVAIPGDYDGDGRTDYAVARQGTPWQFFIRTQGGATQTYQFGVNTDLPVPADYTGDGKTDIAVWRQNEGVFYVRPAQTSGTADFAFKWGQQGDTPAAYYNVH